MSNELRDVGPGTIVMAAKETFKVYKVDKKPHKLWMVLVRDDAFRRNYGKPFFTDRRFLNDAYIVLGEAVCVETMSVKSVPTTWSGPARSKDVNFRTLYAHVAGPREMYDKYLASLHQWVDNTRYGDVDMTGAEASHDPNALKPMVGKRFKKVDLICACLLAHGPSTRDDTLRRVAALEGKPWMKGSNGDYFAITSQAQGAYEPIGSANGKTVYYCTAVGVSRGSQVFEDVTLEDVKSLA